jgi:hypothetical protein
MYVIHSFGFQEISTSFSPTSVIAANSTAAAFLWKPSCLLSIKVRHLYNANAKVFMAVACVENPGIVTVQCIEGIPDRECPLPLLISVSGR